MKYQLKRILLLCGLLSAVLYIVTDLIASFQYPGYRILDQNYSELLATGAPTRPFLLVASAFYNFLVAAFAIGVWTSCGPKRIARITGAVMLAYALISMVTPMFFQMDMRGALETPRGSLHPPMTAVMSLFILLSIGFGAFLLKGWFRWYSFATLVIIIAFGIITSLQAPELSLGQPTPWMGLTERVNIYCTMLWFSLLSILLLRAQPLNLPVKSDFLTTKS